MRKRATAMRWLRILGVVGAGVVVATGCSHGTGSKSSKSAKAPACAFVAKLDEIAATVAHADVRDPDAFTETLTAAVHDYVKNVQGLRAVAPENLHAGLARVEADVQQLRFDAALTDRAELDAYAARTCGRSASGAPTSSPATSSPAGTGALPAGATTTTIAGGLTTTTLASGA